MMPKPSKNRSHTFSLMEMTLLRSSSHNMQMSADTEKGEDPDIESNRDRTTHEG